MEAKDLVEAIRGHGYTQAQITERTGIPQPTVSKIQRGDVSDVMSRNYRALQALLLELESVDPQPSTPELIGQPGAPAVPREQHPAAEPAAGAEAAAPGGA